MTTTVIKSIKPAGGGDYTSLNSWEAANRADLVAGDLISVAEVYSGGNALTGFLDISSGTWVTDSTHYIVIRAAVGEGHTGVYSTSKAYGSVATNTTLSCTKSLHVERMQLKQTHANAMILAYPLNGQQHIYDSCLILRTAVTNGSNFIEGGNIGVGATTILKNCVCIDNLTGAVNVEKVVSSNGDAVDYRVYNCTMIHTGGYGIGVGTGTSENTYWKVATGGVVYISLPNKGTHDATFNAEAVTANLRSIPYTTATFQNVTPGSENLRPVLSGTNKLLDNGANLTAQGVTADCVGVARPQFGAFDIGAFENDIPICWNYTARYKNSTKTFKASGCGSFPKTLKVPSNVDISTGRMIDDGIFINPDEYKVV